MALAVATGLQPMFDIATVLPGFSTAHNGRLAVVFVFCTALLAGWGLDDLMHDRARDPAARRRCCAACAVLLALPLVVMAAGGVARAREAGLGASHGLGLHRRRRSRPAPSAASRS